MKTLLTHALAVTGLAIATQAFGQVTLYEHGHFRGEAVTVDRPAGSLERYNFNNRASSAAINGEAWEFCDRPGFSGRCVVLQPGRYDSLAEMNDAVTSMRPLSARGAPVTGAPPPPAPQGGAQVTFYERHGMHGRSFTTERQVGNLERFGFNNRASSADVSGGSWEVCDGPGFSGRCVVLRSGRYPSLDAMGLNDAVTSARPVARGPEPAPGHSGVGLTLYQGRDFHGQSLFVERPRRRLERQDFDNIASSAVVSGEAWEVCEGEEFSGRCVVLRPGRYASLDRTGMNNRISSARPVGSR
jgi:beta/gamma crystallin